MIEAYFLFDYRYTIRGMSDWLEIDPSLPTVEQLQDQQMRIEADVYAELHEEMEWGEISAEDCEALYLGWLKKYSKPRPDFSV